MKIALVWNDSLPLIKCGFRFEQYIRGFQHLGHKVEIICRPESALGYDGPVRTAEGLDSLSSVKFWKSVAADTAIVITWLRMPDVLAAIRRAGTKVVAFTDSDGQVGLRSYPKITLDRILAMQKRWPDKVKFFIFWLKRYLTDGVLGSDEDKRILESCRNSDVLVFPTRVAGQKFKKFLARSGEEELAERISVVPFTIGETFFSYPIPGHKKDCIVAIGRWSDPQKNAPLLADVLSRILLLRPETEVIIIGSGGKEKFSLLEKRHPSIKYVGSQDQASVAKILASSRILISSSRWESGPMIALEAMTCGATFVGPPLPGLLSWCQEGRFGTVSTSPRPTALVEAFLRETKRWEAGERDPHAIASHWRQHCSPKFVCAQLLADPKNIP